MVNIKSCHIDARRFTRYPEYLQTRLTNCFEYVQSGFFFCIKYVHGNKNQLKSLQIFQSGIHNSQTFLYNKITNTENTLQEQCYISENIRRALEFKQYVLFMFYSILQDGIWRESSPGFENWIHRYKKNPEPIDILFFKLQNGTVFSKYLFVFKLFLFVYFKV